MPAYSRSLERLASEGAIERREVGSQQIQHWLERSERDLALAAHAASIDDSERAATLVYEAGLRACIALLALSGYRLRSGEGHHRAALEAATALGGPEVEPAISRLDDARRYRNNSLYGTARPVGDLELLRLRESAEHLIRLSREPRKANRESR